MKVLIAGFDLFGSVGGGQTYYQNIIRRNPAIEFHYFRLHEAKEARVPPNARALEYANSVDGGHRDYAIDPEVPYWVFEVFKTAQNMAQSVAGARYDIVEIPDYNQFGSLLRPAFRQFDVAVDRFVLSMHGAFSITRALNWWSDGRPIPYLQRLEHMQYEVVDQRYFISEFYRERWRACSPLPSLYFDPLWFFQLPQPSVYRPDTERPIMRFIGRIEKCKGPDLAVNLAWWLSPATYDSLELIGPDSTNEHGDSAAEFLERMIRRRAIPARLCPSQTHEELSRGYARRSVTVAPSVFDSLNLVVLESLFSGCPTVVGSGAGVVRYLQERFPEVPFVRFDVDQFYVSIADVESLLRDYDSRRAALAQALSHADTTPTGPNLADIYRAPTARNESVLRVADRWHAALARAVREPARPKARAAA